jgi:hypothetical protein
MIHIAADTFSPVIAIPNTPGMLISDHNTLKIQSEACRACLSEIYWKSPS